MAGYSNVVEVPGESTNDGMPPLSGSFAAAALENVMWLDQGLPPVVAAEALTATTRASVANAAKMVVFNFFLFHPRWFTVKHAG